jgi:hypothetical protein
MTDHQRRGNRHYFNRSLWVKNTISLTRGSLHKLGLYINKTQTLHPLEAVLAMEQNNLLIFNKYQMEFSIQHAFAKMIQLVNIEYYLVNTWLILKVYAHLRRLGFIIRVNCLDCLHGTMSTPVYDVWRPNQDQKTKLPSYTVKLALNDLIYLDTITAPVIYAHADGSNVSFVSFKCQSIHHNLQKE